MEPNLIKPSLDINSAAKMAHQNNHHNSANNNLTSPVTPGTFQYYSVNPRNQFSWRASNPEILENPAESSEFSDNSDAADCDGGKNPPNSARRRMPTHLNFPRFWSAGGGLLSMALCCTGGGLFAVHFHQGSDLSRMLLQDVFHTSYTWMEAVSISLTALGCLIMALSFSAFASDCITSSNNHKKGPVSSRTPSLVFTALLYPALPIWLLLLGLSITCLLLSHFLQAVCQTEEVLPLWTNQTTLGVDRAPTECKTVLEGEDCTDCIDLYSFHFFFPDLIRKEDMWLCGSEIQEFCAPQSGVPRAVGNFTMCAVGALLVVLGITSHLVGLVHTSTALGVAIKMSEIEDQLVIRHQVGSMLKLSGSRMALAGQHQHQEAERELQLKSSGKPLLAERQYQETQY